MCRIVDLPAPFGPRRPVTPGPSTNEMSLTATTLPYQREHAEQLHGRPRGELALGGCTGGPPRPRRGRSPARRDLPRLHAAIVR